MTGFSCAKIRYNSGSCAAEIGMNSVSGLNLSSRIAWLITIEPSSPDYNLQHLEDVHLSVHPDSQEIHACLIILQAYS